MHHGRPRKKLSATQKMLAWPNLQKISTLVFSEELNGCSDTEKTETDEPHGLRWLHTCCQTDAENPHRDFPNISRYFQNMRIWSPSASGSPLPSVLLLSLQTAAQVVSRPCRSAIMPEPAGKARPLKKLLQRLKAFLGPKPGEGKILRSSAQPPTVCPLVQRNVVPPSDSPAPAHPYERAKSVFFPELVGDRNGSFPAALPTEKRSLLPAVCQ